MSALIWETDPIVWGTAPILWEDPLEFGLIGRKALLIRDGVAVAALRTKTASFTNEGADITSDDDEGWRRFLELDPAERQIEISGDGILKSDALITDTLAVNTEDVYEFAFDGVAKRLIGEFRITSFEVGAVYNDAMTASISLQSTGSAEHKP